MSGCALRRWGSGTPCVKEPDTEAKKEMAAALATMKAERDKQDAMWQTAIVNEPVTALVLTPLNKNTTLS